MSGYVDLHVHYVPAIDDGVKSYEEGVALVEALASIGYARIVTTPHIRTAMFDNRKADLRARFDAFVARATQEGHKLPALDLAAEHFCDDVFWSLHAKNETLPYPGGHALLVEMPQDAFPRDLEQKFFQMQLRGVRPVVAHPERYMPLHRHTDAIDPWLDVGVACQLDLMSLIGKYGRAPQRAAERMLDEGVYSIASSDAHKPADVELVNDAIARLIRIVGDDEANDLLRDNPNALLAGTFEP